MTRAPSHDRLAAMADDVRPEDLALGKRVRELRAARGLTQASLAEAMGRSGHPWYSTTVARTEAGERRLGLMEAVTLVGVLGTTLDHLAGLSAKGAPKVNARLLATAAERAARAAVRAAVDPLAVEVRAAVVDEFVRQVAGGEE